MLFKPYYLVIAGTLVVAVVAAAVIGWRFAIFVLPYSWTGEAERLADLLKLRAGSIVADIGAGDGTLAVEMARRVGERGLVYATELSPERRRDIEGLVSRTGTAQVRIVAAAADATQLPDGCCDGIYMRTVLHHISDRGAFAAAIRKALRPGGRVAVIDFPPGALWFHGRDHGVSAADLTPAFLRAGLSPADKIDTWGGGTYLLLFERARD
jgi:ubiquinone/menaquinone biosynthesis C-methylase UbiE